MIPLTAQSIYPILVKYFPKQNDNYTSDYIEELAELNHFGISSEGGLIALLNEHLDEVLRCDKDAAELCEEERKSLIEEMGYDEVQTRIDNRFWFSYPALLRLALELKFGAEYETFADSKRVG